MIFNRKTNLLVTKRSLDGLLLRLVNFIDLDVALVSDRSGMKLGVAERIKNDT